MPNKQRNTSRIPASILIDTAASLSLTYAQLSRKLGMSDSWAAECVKSNSAPAWSALAIEALLSREGKTLTPDAVVVARIPAHKREAFETIANAMGIKLSQI